MMESSPERPRGVIYGVSDQPYSLQYGNKIQGVAPFSGSPFPVLRARARRDGLTRIATSTVPNGVVRIQLQSGHRVFAPGLASFPRRGNEVARANRQADGSIYNLHSV